ncbi:type I polyketide synthase, partial [Actinophytocola sp.]|uniref:type I polyketide synthase n=1 Tax=Actinophytocola sp. TaxID=1872138 RepID=UPI00389A0232
MDTQDSIAVVGLAANMPKAPNVEAFWQNLRDGVECMTDLSYEDARARGETVDRLRHPNYVFRRPLLLDMEHFDADLFGMSPREAELRDPQHRIFLEVCFSALEHAGYDPARYPGSIGLYAGINANRYVDLHLRQDRELVETVGELALETTNHPDYVTTFTAYKLGLRGPAMTIATACSSSLVSLHQACQALRLGECDMALAGGVEVEWPYGIGYVHNAGGIYSADGYCRPFDANADGTVFGSGAGAVLLKRTSDAIVDGDTVYAVIRGSAVNNDGADKVGFSAPSVTGQTACVAEALAAADVAPASVSYVEAHGTATRLGDPIEVAALTKAYRAVAGDLPTGYCGIGSVKSNVGHLGPASGVAGFIKTVLALWHETLPPNINFTEPNPRLKLDRTPFTVVTEARPWRRDGSPRRAGVSSFGIGGTNAHVVVEEAPVVPAREAVEGRPELLVLSARTTEALARVREDVAQHLAWTDVELADLGHTLRVGRRGMRVREAIVADTSAGAASMLGGPRESAGLSADRIVFAFPGQASQRAGMASGLRRYCDRFRQTFDECLSAFSDLMNRDFLSLWESGDPVVLTDTDVAQPLLFGVEYALSDFLRSLGLPVGAVIGHSLGELVAGTVAGVFRSEDAMRAVAERARLMAGMPRGAMAAVAIAQSDVRPYLGSELSLAAVNGPQEVVLSGPSAAVREAVERLSADGFTTRELSTSHAYHSTMMAQAAAEFREVLTGMRLSVPALPFVSCASGQLVGAEAATPAFWADQLTSPVHFAEAAQEVLGSASGTLVLEVGPGVALTNLLRGTAASRRGRATVRPVLGKATDADAEYVTCLELLGELWQGGMDLDLECLSLPSARRVALPGTPFQRRRYFIDRPPATDDVAPVDTAAQAAPDPRPEPVAVP